ncbi:AraC family transcriptional regulator [Xanthomonas prunicola]|uniref:AraC family transcriptional regulator n=1 Tax=Xanthomonas prunicola TaxID=2053930 RepID=A0A9Q9IZ21_9XANT|nr:transcriptional regulator TagK [Xanthomonas prunicola]USJ02630.1 AraC family transcriptional regulator [Xanthomonas prunicola]UXA47164.1 AraC family transcriptional regulator [Xanthomonas prunicola]UXA54963.1 AraC family transcriptional regulator [Xanthomonas prunicola]UXA55635.1 AraC family transcriptional regulator [Xanthomonas prunicola]UXA61602.1 AraC family transcriptional regulator [Xanthomonas prunicola]
MAPLFSVDQGTGPGEWAAGSTRMSNTSYYSAIVPQAASAIKAHAPLMIDLLAYIEQHIGEAELGTESLQQAFALSRASLYRLFQSRGGVASYIREQRLSMAHRYLQAYPDCSLTWLLYELGFASERQFQRAFQQRFGMPPMQWRRQCRAAPHAPTPRRGHYVPMWRFMRELNQNTQRAEAPVRAGMLPLHSAPLVHTEALRQPPRARAIELEYADR